MASTSNNHNNGDPTANHDGTNGASSNHIGGENQVLGQLPLVHMLLNIMQRQEQTQERQTDILEQLVQSEKGNNSHGGGQAGILREFLQLKPSTLLGSANPLEAED